MICALFLVASHFCEALHMNSDLKTSETLASVIEKEVWLRLRLSCHKKLFLRKNMITSKSKSTPYFPKVYCIIVKNVVCFYYIPALCVRVKDICYCIVLFNHIYQFPGCATEVAHSISIHFPNFSQLLFKNLANL